MGCQLHAASDAGSNMGDLKLKLLEAQAMLHNVRGMEIHNPALAQMLGMLRQLAYEADDVLDELDYFRIQDELEGTYHAADVHAAGRVQDLALHACHTAKACVNKLKFPMCSRAARHDNDNSSKQGFLSGLHFCGGQHEIGSSSWSPANQTKAARNVGKHFSCFSFLPSADHDAPSGMVENSNMMGENEPLQAPKLKFDRVQMSRKILEIIERLKPVCDNVSKVLRQLQKSSHNHAQEIAMNRPETTPLIIEPKLYGRDEHKKIVIDEIVKGESRELTVLPIVGPGGIGKTTFTQHLYDEMKSHFHVPIWICVSFDFNASRLAKDIVKKIPEVNSENKNCSDEELIIQIIRGKRVLLVLDDVWTHHENEWKKLLNLFKKEGAKGNMVIVTTRILQVANMVKTTERSVELERLCHEDIRSFFEECVFGDRKPWVDQPELSEVGSKIVDKMKGSPLAAKTVGRLLRSTLTLVHWRSVLENKEWELESDLNDIMPALKLSYNYLPFHLQQCFSFCGLFPEDYEFGKEELIHFWIGLEILHSCEQKRKRIEDVGLCYLTDLVNHGFFKMNKREDGHPYYVIHDLLHELAVKVSSYECLSIYGSNVRRIQIPTCVRHLSITIDNTNVKDRMSFENCDGNFSALDKQLKVEHLRTLMLFGDHHGSFAKTLGGLFKEATALRVIFLSEASYNLGDILHNFSKLVHLRYLRIKPVYYLDFSLPSVLFRLFHLEVIDLQNVRRCAFSTRNMSNLAKLHHFLVGEDMLRFHSNIYGVGKLKFLQELREFRVGKESDGFELSQLGSLTEIGGSLHIYNLENVQTKEEANESKLMYKNHLTELILEWGASMNPAMEENVLGNLAPHSNLQGLCIRGHGGTNCPTWLRENLSVKYLESLCLDGVSWKNLPPLGEMWMVNELGEECQCCSTSISTPGFYNLKRLELRNISRLKKWVGNGTCPLFSHLEVFIIRRCSELVELPFSNPTCCEAQQEEKTAWFPRLEKLVIAECPKLESLPPIPWQTQAPCSADIKQVGSIESLVYGHLYASKLRLNIDGKGGQSDALWSGLDFSNLTDLESLCMKKMPPLPLGDFQVLSSLKMIRIQGASSSVLPPVEGDGCHGVYRFPVEEVEIGNCETSGKELTLILSFFPNLSWLEISHCKNITGLGISHCKNIVGKNITGNDAETVSGEQRQQSRVGSVEEIITAVAAEEGLLLLPPHLQQLGILKCPKVSILPNPSPDNRTEAGEGGLLQRLRSLRQLVVYDCPEFLSSYSSSSSSSFLFPTCLQDLTLLDMKHMETLQSLSNLTSLTRLYLDLQGDSRDEGLWPLLAHGRLTSLKICADSDLFVGSHPAMPHDKEIFSRSCKLFHLIINTNTGVLAAPICNLLSSTLTKLELRFDTEVERLTEEQEEALQLLTPLQELIIFGGDKLQRLPAGLPNLINLKKLAIFNCSAIRSLPNSLPSSLQELQIHSSDVIKSLPNSLPNSLETLTIQYCRAIKSLPNSLPNSLETLKIIDCRAIKSLPKDGLPSSMRELDVKAGNSEELKRARRKLIGTIPIVRT